MTKGQSCFVLNTKDPVLGQALVFAKRGINDKRAKLFCFPQPPSQVLLTKSRWNSLETFSNDCSLMVAPRSCIHNTNLLKQYHKKKDNEMSEKQ